jgi:hypothetical protein
MQNHLDTMYPNAMANGEDAADRRVGGEANFDTREVGVRINRAEQRVKWTTSRVAHIHYLMQ